MKTAGRGKGWIRVLSGVVLAMAIGLVSYLMWSFTQKDPAALLIDDSASSISTYFAGMADAEMTSDLRAIAGEANDSRVEIKEMIATLEAGDADAAVLSSYQKVLGGIGALKAIDGESLGKWDTASSRIEGGLEQIPPGHDSQAGLTAKGKGALTAVDGVIASARRTMENWAAEVKQIESRNQEVIAQEGSLEVYRDGVKAVNDEYGVLRSETAAMDSDVSGSSEEFGDVMVFFEEGVSQRRALLARLDAMFVPPAMAQVHAQFRDAFSQGVETMGAASDALNAAWRCPVDEEYSCLQLDPRWDHYQSSSGSIGPKLATAEEQLNAEYDRQLRLLNAEPTPPRPIV